MPPFVKNIFIKQNCLFVVLDGSELAPPAIENSRGDYVVFKIEDANSSLYRLDFTNVDEGRTLQFGKWTLIDSQTYFALQFDDDLTKRLPDLKTIFKIATEKRTFDISFAIEQKFSTNRIVLVFSFAKGRADTLDRKTPSGLQVCLACLGIAILKGIYALMKLFPQRNKYTFISKLSKKSPLDIKLLSKYVASAEKDAKIVILAQPMHPYLKYIPHMFKQMWHLATSEAVVLDRSCLVVHVLKHKPDLRIIQLWHALGPMKKFGCANIDTREGQPHQLADLFHMHRGYTDILISSRIFESDFIEGFGLKQKDAQKTFHEIPLPRCDFYLNKSAIEKLRAKFIEKYPQLGEKINILYAPTYRMGDRSIKRAHHAYKNFLDAIDGQKYNVIYSPHPLSKTEIEDTKVVKVAGKTQEKLCIADIVVSDYSTIIYEAGLLSLPTYLYAFDYSQYLKDRELNIDIKKEIPLPFCESAHELVQAIEKGSYNEEKYRSFMNEVVKLPRGKSCCQLIYELMKG